MSQWRKDLDLLADYSTCNNKADKLRTLFGPTTNHCPNLIWLTGCIETLTENRWTLNLKLQYCKSYSWCKDDTWTKICVCAQTLFEDFSSSPFHHRQIAKHLGEASPTPLACISLCNQEYRNRCLGNLSQFQLFVIFDSFIWIKNTFNTEPYSTELCT